MDGKRTVAGLDVYKDSIYLCIMQEGGAIIFEKIYGTLTPELRQMCGHAGAWSDRGRDGEHCCLLDPGMERALRINCIQNKRKSSYD